MSKAAAERKARELLAEVGARVPVDVNAAAGRVGLSVVKEDLEDSVSGMLVLKDGRGVIGVNENHHPNRSRFTVAHEIAHYLLHRESASVFVDANPVFFRDGVSATGTEQQEIEANAFAAELLMPEAELLERLGGRPIDAFDEMSVRRLAAHFGVSAQALTIRLTRLGLVTEF